MTCLEGESLLEGAGRVTGTLDPRGSGRQWMAGAGNWAMMPLRHSVPLRESGAVLALGRMEVATPLFRHARRTPPALLRDLGAEVEAAARRELRSA